MKVTEPHVGTLIERPLMPSFFPTDGEKVLEQMGALRQIDDGALAAFAPSAAAGGESEDDEEKSELSILLSLQLVHTPLS